MSVIVKGMEMPECCYDCPFIRASFAGDYYCAKGKGDEDDLKKLYSQRMADCPLVEIPTPHGRLIDADKIEYENWYLEETGESYKMVGKDDIDGMSTIIEAEGENT